MSDKDVATITAEEGLIELLNKAAELASSLIEKSGDIHRIVMKNIAADCTRSAGFLQILIDSKYEQ